MAAVSGGRFVVQNRCLRGVADSCTASLGDIESQLDNCFVDHSARYSGLLRAGVLIEGEFICACHRGCKVNPRWSSDRSVPTSDTIAIGF